MPIYKGSNKLKELQFGNIKIKEVYYGSSKVYSKVSFVTLIVVPTYSNASVTLTAEGYTQVGNSIIVPKGTAVTVTLTADRCDTNTFVEVVNENKTINPQIKRSHIAPIITYNAGASYQVGSWIDRGQCIVGGNYTLTRGAGEYLNNWNVTVNALGEVQSLSASGNIVMRTASTTPITITPAGGWNFTDMWI